MTIPERTPSHLLPFIRAAAGDLLAAFGIFRWRMGLLPLARKKIVENLRDPILVIDQEGLIVDFNDAIRGLFGSAYKEMRGRPAMEVMSSLLPDCLAVLESRAQEAEISLGRGPDELDFSVRMFPVIRDENARIMVFRDITELKRGERALRALSVALERKVEERVIELEAEVRRRRATETRLTEVNSEIEKTRKEIMITLSEVVENREKETASHVARVSEYCRVLGLAAGLGAEEADMLANAAAMHDIGKIGIPDFILEHRDALSPEEQAIMRSHTRIGAELLGKSDDPLLRTAAHIALEHHERWDGSGYPDGKKGMAISRYARIVAVCDVFDSLSASRPYREAWEIEEILRYFRTERGVLFEPALVDFLFSSLDGLFAIVEKYPDRAETLGEAENLIAERGDERS